MSFTGLKKSYLDSGLLRNFTDIHSHVLPGVDDGVGSYEEAINTLRWLKAIGVNRLYLTPHVMSDFSGNTSSYLSGKFGLFVKRIKDDGITDIPLLKLGAEYMLEAAFGNHKKDGLLTYSKRHLLVETSYIMPPMGFIQIIENLQEDGYTPVLAHPERYIFMEGMKDYRLMKSQGVKFQLNFLSITGAYGRQAKEKAGQLLKAGYYDYTGSDFHHLSRHEKDYLVKSLTKKQIISIQRLIDNNEELW